MKNKKRWRVNMRKVIAVMLTAVLVMALPMTTLAESSQRKLDINEMPSPWAVEAVQRAYLLNLIPEGLDGAFTQAITRAEFAAFAVRLYETATGREITERAEFYDTTNINVQKMGGLGVVTGIGGRNFAPHNALTRQEAAVILVHLAYAIGFLLPTEPASFADNTYIQSWALEAVGQMQMAEIMDGVGDNNFEPGGQYTREQSIVTMLRLYDILEANGLVVVKVDLSGQDITDQRLAEMVASGEIPANVTHLHLAVNYITDISPLRSLTGITYLDLAANNIIDVSPLRNLTGITHLRLAANYITDTSPLGSLTNLIELDLWGNRVADVSPLGSLTGLTELNLWGNEFVDISYLSDLTNLTVFSVGDNLYFDGDISVLRNFTNLTHLGLGCTWRGQIRDFSSIEGLVNLQSLQLWGVTWLDDLSVFNGLTNLTSLTIHGANIQDYTPLGNLVGLTSLNLQSSQIRDVSRLRLYNFPNLTELSLFNNQIEDIATLRGLATLTSLSLRDNEISDLSPLAELTSLGFLDLSNNQITDASPLSSLRGLWQLNLNGNQIEATHVAWLQSALRGTFIVY